MQEPGNRDAGCHSPRAYILLGKSVGSILLLSHILWIVHGLRDWWAIFGCHPIGEQGQLGDAGLDLLPAQGCTAVCNFSGGDCCAAGFMDRGWKGFWPLYEDQNSALQLLFA